MKGIKIVAAGKYLPKNIVTNQDFARIVDTSDEWITQRTGMKERHLSSGESTWAMGAFAAKDALESSGIDPETIDLIVCTSVSGDYLTPSMACLIQREIGAGRAMCMDVNAACAGFVYALDLARRYLCFDDVKRVLIVSSELLSKITDYTDRASCVLFGDAAGACIVEAEEDGLYGSYLSADGGLAHCLYCKSPYEVNHPFVKPELVPEYQEPIHPENHYLHMDGREVYKFAVKAMPEALRQACGRVGIEVSDLDIIIPHQANIRIVETAAKTLGVSMDKIFVNLEKYGNTSSACIPMCIKELMESGRLLPGQKVGLVGFGAGVTYAAAVFQW